MDRGKVMVNNGKLTLIIKEIGKRIKSQAMEKSISILEKSIKEISKKDYLMVKESLLILIKVYTMVNSKIVRKMD